MLKLDIAPQELFNDSTSEFITIPGATIELEHSLISISKWESKWRTPFLTDSEHPPDRWFDYIKCMCVTRGIPDETFNGLTESQISIITEYINTDQTATWFTDEAQNRPSTQVITSELIYYWMISYTIPFDCQKWPLSRLLTLIRVCEKKNAPPKKTSRADLHAKMRQLNAERRAKYNTRG